MKVTADLHDQTINIMTQNGSHLLFASFGDVDESERGGRFMLSANQSALRASKNLSQLLTNIPHTARARTFCVLVSAQPAMNQTGRALGLLQDEPQRQDKKVKLSLCFF
jgi:hypothetical protein